MITRKPGTEERTIRVLEGYGKVIGGDFDSAWVYDEAVRGFPDDDAEYHGLGGCHWDMAFDREHGV